MLWRRWRRCSGSVGWRRIEWEKKEWKKGRLIDCWRFKEVAKKDIEQEIFNLQLRMLGSLSSFLAFSHSELSHTETSIIHS